MNQQMLGLVGAGPLSRSFVTKLPALRSRLGPVLAPCQRLASRLVNALRAGYAIQRYEELGAAETLLIAVPDAVVAEAVSALAKADLELSGKIVLLCDSRLDSSALQPLARRGAMTASLSSIPGLALRYVAEGERRAVREARLLAEEQSARIYELPPGGKAVFLAAMSFTGGLALAVVDAAARCLRAAGLPSPACDAVCEQLLLKTLRAYLHAGRKAWSGVLADGERGEVARELAALEEADASLAAAYRVLARLALERFERDTAWLDQAFRQERRQRRL